MLNPNLLRAAARAYGLQCSYRTVDGKIVWSPEKTLLKMLFDFSKVEIRTDNDLISILDKVKKSKYENIVEPTLVGFNGLFNRVRVYLKNQPEQKLKSLIVYESNSEKEIELNLRNYRKTDLGFHAIYEINEQLPVGYHLLKLLEKEIFLICPPEKININNKKSWGPFVPMYALKTENDWGIGSLKEAKELAQKLKPYGAKWMGLLPTLAGNFDHEDCDPSPYSSLSRLFWNEIYLDVDSLISKYNLTEVNRLIQTNEFQEKLKSLRNKKYVDYYSVYQIKKSVLKILAQSFFAQKLDQQDSFKQFVSENPEIYSYAKFRSSEKSEQEFHIFCQYEMNLALANFEDENGIGLYMDYPVGVNDAGFDFKEFRNVFYGEVSVGAPPEPVFALGQDWGFPAFHPEGMRKDQYRYFRKSLKQHLKYCKILRLDHIMGLHRIYSVPKKFKGHEGVYLRFKPEELFAVVILEAHRAGADLIGENLGTVPDAVNKIMNERKINGMWVLQCETWRSPEASFAAILENSLVCINTHDMPMLASFQTAEDLTLVESLKILSSECKSSLEKDRKVQVANWQASLSKDHFVSNAIKNIAESKAKYFVVNLEDMWGEKEPQNIPGTWREYPNWRKKFSKTINSIDEGEEAKLSLSYLKRSRS
ncbi:MAG: 4-alpha-glucanotransferase [Bacteriovoracaceae bacterium]